MNNPYKPAKWLLRLILIIAALFPLAYFQDFYDHFYAYLTGTIISNVITTQWGVVILSILVFAFFLIPLNYRRKAKWLDYSLGIAFFVSLFIEMYGIPLTILFASKYLFNSDTVLPANVIEFNFLGVSMGMDLPMLYGAILMTLGMVMIALGWWSIYRQTEKDAFATSGIYSISRHPQYLGFTLLLLGWFFGWPTIITVVFTPILIYKYLKAAYAEEKEMSKIIGKAYQDYSNATPFLI